MKPPNNDARHIRRSILERYPLIRHMNVGRKRPTIVARGSGLWGKEHTEGVNTQTQCIMGQIHKNNMWKWKDMSSISVLSVCGVSAAAERHKKKEVNHVWFLS